jgi:hypothetical protein
MPSNRPAVRIDFVGRAADIDDALWNECFPPPREGRFWYHALDRCGLEDQFTFFYGLISCEGKNVGIAPCFLHDVPITLVAPPLVAAVLKQVARVFPRAGFQRTFFIGSPCSDEGTIGLVGGVNLADVMIELQAAVRTKARSLGARMIVFKDFVEADAAVIGGAGRAGEFVVTASYPGTAIVLPPGSKEDYYRGLSHNQRHNLLKKLRRSRAALALETSVVARPSDADLAEIFGLFLQTYERGKTKFERLDLRFFEQIREVEPARFILLRDLSTGRLVAFMLVFVLGDKVINKFIGLDYRLEGPVFLYFRLFDAFVDFAYASGAKDLQSGQTGYRAKLDLGHGLVPLFNVFRHEQAPVHAIFRAIGRRISWASLDSDLVRFGAEAGRPRSLPGRAG